jgi:hypothetical protein
MIRWTFSSVSLTMSGLKNHLSLGSDQFKGVQHRRPYLLDNYCYMKTLPMVNIHPIFVGTPEHMPATCLRVFDSLSQSVHLFENDRPNCGAA